MIVFTGLPIPPSSNNQYRSFMRGGKIVHVKSPEYVFFKSRFEGWCLENHEGIRAGRALVKDCAIEVEAYIGLTRERILTKRGSFKRMDVSNRLKALHDCLADALHIDDSAFFSITAEKFIVPTAMDEAVIVRISPFQPREASDIREIL